MGDIAAGLRLCLRSKEASIIARTHAPNVERSSFVCEPAILCSFARHKLLVLGCTRNLVPKSRVRGITNFQARRNGGTAEAVLWRQPVQAHPFSEAVPFKEGLERLDRGLAGESNVEFSRNCSPGELFVSFTTFNVLAPIYKRIGCEDSRESSLPEVWLPRNKSILEMLLSKRSSVICLQEMWLANQGIVDLFQGALAAWSYTTLLLPRPNGRGDGLLTAVRADHFHVAAYEEVLFHDCGDRVAQFLWLQPCMKSRGGEEGVEDAAGGVELVVVNTHLLFPHDAASSLVRIREAYKLLEHLAEFQRRYAAGCAPVVVCGDLNGTKEGEVYKFLRSQGFVSSYDASRNHSDAELPWVSHRNHHGVLCGVDFIWLRNPGAEPAAPAPVDWRAAVLRYLQAKLEACGYTTAEEAFAYVCGRREEEEGMAPPPLAADTRVTLENFERALNWVAAELLLTADETQELVEVMGSGGGGSVDFREFWFLMCQLAHLQRRREGEGPPSCAVPGAAPEPSRPWAVSCAGGGLQVKEATLFPRDMEEGRWPPDYNLSDHGVLSVTFSAS